MASRGGRCRVPTGPTPWGARRPWGLQMSGRAANPTATSGCGPPFADVPPEYWAAGYIRWVACQGLVSGYADGRFRPEAATTRGQLAKLVVVAAGFPLGLPPGAPHFTDVPPG